MADIPDQPVMRRLEDVVKRHCQLDNAKASAEMTMLIGMAACWSSTKVEALGT